MTPCQEYDGSLNGDGYGQIRVGAVKLMAHRLAWAMHNGADPSGMVVRHDCDNPPCVNPEHLRIGTVADNAKDMVVRGRSCKGEAASTSVLTKEDVRQIRCLRALGVSGVWISCLFSVTRSAVCHIHKRRTWGWL